MAHTAQNFRYAIYGKRFQGRVGNFGIEEILIAPRSPWQNPYLERLIGFVRRDCLNHLIVLNAHQLTHMFRAYFHY